MSEMVERVARRLFGPANELWDHRWKELHETGLTYVKWLPDLTEGKAFYRGQAVVAISELREPTEAVLVAGCAALQAVPRADFMAAELSGDRYAMPRMKMIARWRAMIEAALK